jgi:hypothetical protein
MPRNLRGHIGRLKAEEPPACPGVYRVRMFRVRSGFEDAVPVHDHFCLDCNRAHEPAPGTNPIRQILIVIPEAAAGRIPECGWREETAWRG